MSFVSSSTSTARTIALAFSLLALPSLANAHVKWFATWDIICPPRDPLQVLLSPVWQAFFFAAMGAIAFLAWLDHRLEKAAIVTRWAGRAEQMVLPHAMLLLRCGLCAYWSMAAFGLARPVYLTPELAAPLWISWVQVACAVLVLSGRTAWLAGCGLLFFYAMAIADHGWFHLLDYPLFAALGVILVLARSSLSHRDLLNLLRWGAAVTLIWGGIEKFAYPQWTFPVMLEKPFLRLGLDPETAMFIYGFGEIALSFGLLLFGRGSQVAAALLLFVFVAAVPPFGWIDLVGHSGIIVALVLLMLTSPGKPLILRCPLRNAAAHGALFATTLATFGGAYVMLHAVYLEQVTARTISGPYGGTATAPALPAPQALAGRRPS